MRKNLENLVGMSPLLDTDFSYGFTTVETAPPAAAPPRNITEEIQNSRDLYQTFTNLYGANPGEESTVD